MAYNPFSLEGKTVLVTGASSGIGRATAIVCAKLGARLIITGRNEARLNETFAQLAGEGHQQILAELTNTEEVTALIQKCPTLEGLVLCAGKGMTLPFLFCSREKFDSVFNVNFFAPAEVLRLLVKGKKLKRGASVVIISSIGGAPGGRVTPGNSVYGMSKAAIWSLMRFAARELAPKMIRVNTVNPGMVETPLIHSGAISEAQHQADMEKYPLKRYGKPEDIAHGIVYLLSDAASWVTGQSLVIDGGITI